VKAFNTTFAGTLVEGPGGGAAARRLHRGRRRRGKQTVGELARAGALNPIDAGRLRRARELERLGFLHMALQEGLGTSYGSALKVIA
jgi:8-hydroxy-5-deazaflavin:NADPH oxidoreductase